MKNPPDVGSRWQFSPHGATYEIVDEDVGEGYVAAKIVSNTTDAAIGGVVQLRLDSLGTTYKRVKKT